VAVSPSSSVQRARQELADRLHDLRLDAGLTGRGLSVASGWHEAKTSRIESAKQAPSDADIRIWCGVCGVAEQAADLIAASRAADSMYTEWKRLHRTGMRRAQDMRVPLYEKTKLFKVYANTLVPGFLQTPGYAKALMSAITDFQQTPDDVEEAVRARISRNRLLASEGRRFILLMEESVLRFQVGDKEAMSTQLAHLMACTGLPNVRIGVIPFSAESRSMWPLETFNVFDDARVHVETLTAQLTVTVPGEIVVYLRDPMLPQMLEAFEEDVNQEKFERTNRYAETPADAKAS
jgi:transcriptional regulator with XRE-family HTH domain